MLYKTTSEKAGSVVQSLTWVEESKDGKQLYQLRTESPNLTKNEFLAMVAQKSPWKQGFFSVSRGTFAKDRQESSQMRQYSDISQNVNTSMI